MIQLCLLAAIWAMSQIDPVAEIEIMAILALTVAFLSASQDIVIDAFRIESLNEFQQGAGAAALVGGYRTGMLVSTAGALYLAEFYGWTTAYSLMAAVVLVGAVVILLRPEPGRENEGEWSAEAQEARAEGLLVKAHLSRSLARAAGWLYAAVVVPFVEFMRRPGWVLILLFVAFYKFGDSLAGVMTGPFLIEIGFSKIEIANTVKIFGFGATMLGLIVGGAMVYELGMIRSLWICGFLQLASNFMFAVQAMIGADIGLLAVTIGFENLAGGMGTAVFVAYMSSLCNVSYTATQYALVSSFMAMARTWGSAPSGYLAEWLGWVDFFILTAGAAVPGLVLLWWLTRAPRTAPG